MTGGQAGSNAKHKSKGQMKERHAAALFSSPDWEAMLRTLDGCANSDSHPKVT